MEYVELKAESRTVYGKKVKRLRAEQLIPAVVYGPDLAGKSIQVQERLLFTTLQQAGSTMLINLSVDDEPKPHVVLAREIQRDPLTSRVQHVDFYEVRLTETVRTTPRIEIVGESPLVKAGQAVLIHGMNEIEVECLPTDLISTIPVDISGLETMDDNVLVGDLPVPDTVTVIADPGDVVVSVVPVRVELEEELEEEEVLEGEEIEEEAVAEAEPEE
ncbi:MAG: 50S ribosomal protein L25 [Anaerolineae bacterium]|jgi:large subunit ribosomal protein L25